jgi:hypothetical protein
MDLNRITNKLRHNVKNITLGLVSIIVILVFLYILLLVGGMYEVNLKIGNSLLYKSFLLFLGAVYLLYAYKRRSEIDDMQAPVMYFILVVWLSLAFYVSILVVDISEYIFLDIYEIRNETYLGARLTNRSRSSFIIETDSNRYSVSSKVKNALSYNDKLEIKCLPRTGLAIEIIELDNQLY